MMLRIHLGTGSKDRAVEIRGARRFGGRERWGEHRDASEDEGLGPSLVWPATW
jgi:hypothetical protein